MLNMIFKTIEGTLTADISNASPLVPIDIDTLALLQTEVNFPGDERTRQTVTDGSGSYVFTDLAAGSYVAIAFDPEGTYRSKVVHTVIP